MKIARNFEELKYYASQAGNQTLVSYVTDGDIHNYTTKDVRKMRE